MNRHKQDRGGWVTSEAPPQQASNVWESSRTLQNKFLSCQQWHNFYGEALLSSQGAGFMRLSAVCQALVCPQRASEVSWLWVTNAEHAALPSEVAISHPARSRPRRSAPKGQTGQRALSPPLEVNPTFHPSPSLTRQVAKCLFYSDTELLLRSTALRQEKNIPTLPQIKRDIFGIFTSGLKGDIWNQFSDFGLQSRNAVKPHC